MQEQKDPCIQQETGYLRDQSDIFLQSLHE
jgi:hypothetical protein